MNLFNDGGSGEWQWRVAHPLKVFFRGILEGRGNGGKRKGRGKKEEEREREKEEEREKRARKKVKTENGEEKKGNCKRGGGKLKMEGGKV